MAKDTATKELDKFVNKLQKYTNNGCGLEAKIEIANRFFFTEESVELNWLKELRDVSGSLSLDEWTKSYNICKGMIEKIRQFNPALASVIDNAL